MKESQYSSGISLVKGIKIWGLGKNWKTVLREKREREGEIGREEERMWTSWRWASCAMGSRWRILGANRWGLRFFNLTRGVLGTQFWAHRGLSVWEYRPSLGEYWVKVNYLRVCMDLGIFSKANFLFRVYSSTQNTILKII